MSIPDEIGGVKIGYDEMVIIVVALLVIGFAYVIVFHAIPLNEARVAEMDEIKNNMSCGDLKQMILDNSAMSQANRAQVKHQYEWRCEK